MIFFYELFNLLCKYKTLNYRKISDTNPSSKGIPAPIGLGNSEDCFACKSCERYCPTKAIQIVSETEIQFDYGACTQCGLCVEICEKEKLENSGFVNVFALNREEFVIRYKNGNFTPKEYPISPNVENFRKLTKRKGFNFREIAAGGNNCGECEIGASFNNVFDSESEGVKNVASPKHADAIVYTGPISENMKEPLSIAWNVMPKPKALIACGTEAISGGVFTLGERPCEPDLFIAGDPPRPDVSVSAYRLLMGRIKFSFQIKFYKRFQELKERKHER
ncbi:MAG: 4Fe-4S dicluster domain-containing protein [Leptospiraceae bacterium]|nr:4Fe-4S dicluster domain-containing protein [Leptospiraceae bacterium]MCK6380656.1 4Fe-4S dicluster domain-containing protein [Leptospiraceae bacterium]NUM41530.1 4Fe-4S dicluster domain-containing protein [Leptospiraceae bacterium]